VDQIAKEGSLLVHSWPLNMTSATQAMYPDLGTNMGASVNPSLDLK
jgi:hypothetical protein